MRSEIALQDEDLAQPSRRPTCPFCSKPRPPGRLIYCSADCAAFDRAFLAALLAVANDIDAPSPVPAGNPTQIEGLLPGDRLYLRQVPFLFMQVLAVRREGGALVATEVRHGQAGRRRLISIADLEGWKRYGHIDAGGAFASSPAQAGGAS